MTRKQKKVFYRIIISAILLAGLMAVTHVVELDRWILLGLYLIPYIVIGYDIL